MKKFRIIFYKAKLGDGHFLDDGISAWTTLFNTIGLLACLKFKLAGQVLKRRYSHVELQEPDENGDFYTYTDRCRGIYGDVEPPAQYRIYLGTCFTSTLRGDDNGTVMRPACDILKNPHRWDYMEIEVLDEDYDRAKAWADEQCKNNKGYNKKTVADFFNPFRKTHKPVEDEQNICSVAVQGFLWKMYMFNKWMIWSPLKLWWKLDKMGHETKSLKG